MLTAIIKYTKLPILLIGAPGIGKTAKVLQAFDHVEVLLASAMVEEDIAGIPYKDKNGIEHRTIPSTIHSLHLADKEGKTTCLFLDEMDKARRGVADTLLTLVQSRRVGNNKLPDNTAIIGAANPPQFGGGDGISQAMLNRFSVIEMEPEIAEWKKHTGPLLKKNKTKKVFEAICNGEIPFIDSVGEGLSFRLTSPRSLSNVLALIDSEIDPNNALLEKLINGLVTAPTASAIMFILNKADNLDVKEKSRATFSGANKKHLVLRI